VLCGNSTDGSSPSLFQVYGLSVIQVNYGEFSSNFSENQAIYLVKVAIDQQSIKAYGIKHPLKVGMVFEADIMQENRKLYEWVLEPLFSISGKL
ncbi:hypothetical protein KTH19_18825, partial [Acinetobacter sp. WU_MDCI_Abxc22]|nr:hypothetical protein [Acinetobacter sp. WU_MDCI_Abxc22]